MRPSIPPILPCVLLLLLLSAVIAPAVAQSQDTSGAQPVATHYALSRPIPPNRNVRVAQGFPFGWHRRNQSPLHHGVDILNPRGTPVIAAADGTVYYAGNDLERVFGERANFYGNLVILQHDFDSEGGRVFTLYGHLNTVDVEAGARVAMGDKIGTVGATGIAIGSHLHFEVRIGNPDDYFAVRNPELWYAPLPGSGTLIGRMVNPDGSLASGVRYALSNARSVYYGFTYADPNLRADPAYNENFALGDLPAGCYALRVRGGAGYVYNETLCIQAGETLYVEMKLTG